MIIKRCLAFCSLVTLGFDSIAFAWGERGHHTISRVASHLVAAQKDPDRAAFGAFLQKREFMLGHLSNVPDIVWRSMGKDIDALNGPSHYIDLEFLLPSGPLPGPAAMPNNMASFLLALKNNCTLKDRRCAPGKDDETKISKAGHAPFRIEALGVALKLIFVQLKQLEQDPKANPEQQRALSDEALLYTGIIAHFVGDLANPHHSSEDYDGWQTNQGGLHSYFETDVVDAQGLGVELAVFNRALKNQPAAAIFATSKQDLLTMTWALALNSHAELDTLRRLDRQHSLVKNSGSGKNQRAVRKTPEAAASQYQDFIESRLATGADALATIWINQWEAAGKPKMGGFQSYNYPVKPDFIPLNYTGSQVKSK